MTTLNLNPLFAAAADTMLTPAREKVQTYGEVGLSVTKVLKSAKQFHLFVDQALQKHLDFQPRDVVIFSKTLRAYLDNLGIENEKMFAMTKDFPRPPEKFQRKTSDGKTEKLDPSLINHTILRGLSSLATITRITNKSGFFLEDPAKIELAHEWTQNVTEINKSKIHSGPSRHAPTPSSHDTKKYPDITLKKFTSFDGKVTLMIS